jgi:uncharacterized protein YcaQ
MLFDFHYRSEIYTPKAKRKYGYYVMPILHGEELIGRIDPKLDRKTKTLHVYAAFAEPNAPLSPAVGAEIARAIAELAQFLGAKKIDYGDKLPGEWELQ